jgi:S-DNA-T family DNA segregation ATPase FtsK/SpoIIIE
VPPKRQKKPNKPRFTTDLRLWQEIAVVLLFALGGLTIAGLFSVAQGGLVETWLMVLRRIFGWGVIAVAPAMMAVAAILLLQLFDRHPDLHWEIIIGLAGLFVVGETLLHQLTRLLAQPTSPSLSIAEAGEGGGYLGHLISQALIAGLGEAGAALLLIALGIVCVILVFHNTSWTEIQGWAFRGRTWLQDLWDYKLFPRFTVRRPDSGGAGEPSRLEKLKQIVRPLEDEEETSPERPLIISRYNEPLSPHSPTTGPIAKIARGSQEWKLPPLEILSESAELELSQAEIRSRVRIIEETLESFGVQARVVEVSQGPTVTQFGLRPETGVKVSRVTALEKDLSLTLAASPIRIEAPVPGKSIIGIEVPNSDVALVGLRSVMDTSAFRKMKGKLRVALGQDVAGQPIVAELGHMPHLLIAGATGSGKSVCINSIICCFLMQCTPDELRFLMVDPKMVELTTYNGIPHLLSPVITDVEKVIAALKWLTREMDRRYKLFQEAGARNLEAYNSKLGRRKGEGPLPYIVFIVDELADLMMASPDEMERRVCRLAQMARATGIHLVLATQRPSVDVVTGLIKANFPARISFAMVSGIDSRVVLDTSGAEKLLGKGDMLYMASDSSSLLRLQGTFVSDKEIEDLVKWWTGKSQAEATPSQPPLWTDLAKEQDAAKQEDPLFEEAVRVVKENQRASTSLLQRRLRIGYSRAARLMDIMEERGIIGTAEGSQARRVVLEEEDEFGTDDSAREP